MAARLGHLCTLCIASVRAGRAPHGPASSDVSVWQVLPHSHNTAVMFHVAGMMLIMIGIDMVFGCEPQPLTGCLSSSSYSSDTNKAQARPFPHFVNPNMPSADVMDVMIQKRIGRRDGVHVRCASNCRHHYITQTVDIQHVLIHASLG